MQVGKYRLVPPEEMIHVMLYSLDGVMGLSPITQAREQLGALSAMEKYGARYFGNGAIPSTLLIYKGTNKLDPKTQQELKDSYKREHGGVNQHSIGLVTGDWDVKTFSVTPEDSQFLQGKVHSRTQVAELFRLPPSALGDVSRLSNANHEQESLKFIQDCLTPYLIALESELNLKLLPSIGRNSGRYYYRFDVSERLRGDFKSTMEGYATQVQWGLRLRNEIRAEMGLEPIPGGEVPWMPVNMAPAGAQQTQEPVQQPNDETDDTTDTGDDAVRSLRPLYIDSVGRLLNREKRDLSNIAGIFTPLLIAIRDIYIAQARSKFRFDAEDTSTFDAVLKDALSTIQKRAANWTDADAALNDYERVLKSVKLGVFREAGALVALQQ